MNHNEHMAHMLNSSMDHGSLATHDVGTGHSTHAHGHSDNAWSNHQHAGHSESSNLTAESCSMSSHASHGMMVSLLIFSGLSNRVLNFKIVGSSARAQIEVYASYIILIFVKYKIFLIFS